MARTRSPIFDLINQVRGFGRAADAVARAADKAAQARAAGLCLVCGQNAALPNAEYCGNCRADAVEAGAETAKSAIDKLKEALIGRR